MSLLPSSPDTTAADDADPRVVDVDSEDADDILAALSSGTARALLSALHDEPASPSDLADRVDTSLQNAQYHLEKLETAGAVEVIDTVYSEKGREMDVYAPADQPLVIFAGKEEKGSTLKSALSRLLGSVGILALASLAIQQWFGRGGLFGGRVPTAGGGEEAVSGATGTPTPDATSVPQDTPTATPEPAGEIGAQEITESPTPVSADTTAPTETPTQPDPETTTAAADTVREAGAGLPPGLLFFMGGLFIIAVLAAVLYVRR